MEPIKFKWEHCLKGVYEARYGGWALSVEKRFPENPRHVTMLWDCMVFLNGELLYSSTPIYSRATTARAAAEKFVMGELKKLEG